MNSDLMKPERQSEAARPRAREERKEDEKRMPAWDSRKARDPERDRALGGEGHGEGRDRDRSDRERREKEAERDRERARDREEKEREREKERDRERREREKEQQKEKEREREKELKDRERERERERNLKDRDRDRDGRDRERERGGEREAKRFKDRGGDYDRVQDGRDKDRNWGWGSGGRDFDRERDERMAAGSRVENRGTDADRDDGQRDGRNVRPPSRWDQISDGANRAVEPVGRSTGPPPPLRPQIDPEVLSILQQLSEKKLTDRMLFEIAAQRRLPVENIVRALSLIKASIPIEIMVRITIASFLPLTGWLIASTHSDNSRFQKRS